MNQYALTAQQRLTAAYKQESTIERERKNETVERWGQERRKWRRGPIYIRDRKREKVGDWEVERRKRGRGELGGEQLFASTPSNARGSIIAKAVSASLEMNA